MCGGVCSPTGLSVQRTRLFSHTEHSVVIPPGRQARPVTCPRSSPQHPSLGFESLFLCCTWPALLCGWDPRASCGSGSASGSMSFLGLETSEVAPSLLASSFMILSRARARAGMLRSRSRPTAQRGVTSELRGSNSDEARGPGRAVRSRLGVLIEGGVSTAAQTRSRARAPSASGFGRCAWLPPLRSGSAPAAALGGAETPAMRRKPVLCFPRCLLHNLIIGSHWLS